VLHDQPRGLGQADVAALQLRRAKGLLLAAGRVFRSFECADAEGLLPAAAAAAAAAASSASGSGNSGTSHRGGGGSSDGSDGSSNGGSSGGSGGSGTSAAAVQGGFKEFSERVQRHFGGAPPADAKKKKKTWRDQLAEQVSNGSAPGQPRPAGGTPPRSNAADL
jgi:hypothetical protein